MAEIARRQHGNVTYRQLLGCELTRNEVAARVTAGHLYRIHRGVYAVGHPPKAPIERAAAAVLAGGAGAALGHEGSLALWGFTHRWPATFDVITTTDRRLRGIRTHQYTGLTRADITVQLGIRTTSPARTLLDCAPRLHERARTRVIADALHTPFLTQNQLADVHARFPRHPGAALLEPFLDATNPTRSVMEDDFKAFCARHSLPTPLINVPVAGHIVDALFPAHRLIVELDSWEFHKDRRTFEADRERDADTLQAGHATVRLTWPRLHHSGDAEADRLRQILSARL